LSLPRVLNGIHVSNHPNRFVEQMAQASRPNGAAVVMHQLMFPYDAMTDDHGDAENDHWMKLRYGHEGQRIEPAPERLLIVRIWNTNDPFRFDPAVRAEYVVSLLERWHSHGYPDHSLLDDPFVAVQATNEANIEPRSMLDLEPTERYDKIAVWEHAFWDAFDRAAPGRRCLSCGPNLAFGHDWLEDTPDSEYDHPGINELCRRHVETGGMLGLHVYYHGNRPWERGGPGEDNQYWFWMRPFRPTGYRDTYDPARPHDKGGVLARFPDAPIAVTEAGTWLHSDADRTDESIAAFTAFMDRASEARRVHAFCPFIWDTDHRSHPENIIVPNEGLREALVELPNFLTRAPLPSAAPGWDPGAEEAPREPAEPPADRAAPPIAPAEPPVVRVELPPDGASEMAPPPRRTDVVVDAVVCLPGEGWAQLAGRAAGRPDARYEFRLDWAKQLIEANGLPAETLGDPDLPEPGRAYLVPNGWFEPAKPLVPGGATVEA
jgi:hypothetical protein